MNWFRTHYLKVYPILSLIGILLLEFEIEKYSSFQNSNIMQEQPLYSSGETIYADFDTERKLIYLLVGEELWTYNLSSDIWKFLSLINIPKNLNLLEFGFNNDQKKLLFWDRGVGNVFEIDLSNFKVSRIDLSFSHENQYAHYPFFYNGYLHAFGGYGFWEWKNIITYFDSDLKEWKIVDVKPTSIKPEKREQVFGQYIPSINKLYIAGGTSSEDQKQDDKNVKKVFKNDVWSFSFDTNEWTYHQSIKLPVSYKYGIDELDYLGPRNTVTSSFFSSKSNLWYLPIHSHKNSKLLYSFKPYNLATNEDLPIINLSGQLDREAMISNFLFDQKENTLLLVTFDYLTNTDKFPIRIIELPEDELVKLVPEPTFHKGLYLLFLIPILGLLYLATKKITRKESFQVISLPDFINSDDINKQEKDLITKLLNISDGIDALELEESIWPEIDNYDYRRKLRNKTINSVNTKFTKHTMNNTELIIRTKDSNDSRRLLYSLNREII